jgi:hypothetical protein
VWFFVFANLTLLTGALFGKSNRRRCCEKYQQIIRRHQSVIKYLSHSLALFLLFLYYFNIHFGGKTDEFENLTSDRLTTGMQALFSPSNMRTAYHKLGSWHTTLTKQNFRIQKQHN